MGTENFSIDDVVRAVNKKDRRLLAPKLLRKLMFRLADQHLMDDVAIMAIEQKFTEDQKLTPAEYETLLRFKKLADRSASRRLQVILTKIFKTL